MCEPTEETGEDIWLDVEFVGLLESELFAVTDVTGVNGASKLLVEFT